MHILYLSFHQVAVLCLQMTRVASHLWFSSVVMTLDCEYNSYIFMYVLSEFVH